MKRRANIRTLKKKSNGIVFLQFSSLFKPWSEWFSHVSLHLVLLETKGVFSSPILTRTQNITYSDSARRIALSSLQTSSQNSAYLFILVYDLLLLFLLFYFLQGKHFLLSSSNFQLREKLLCSAALFLSKIISSQKSKWRSVEWLRYTSRIWTWMFTCLNKCFHLPKIYIYIYM